ncbi:CobW family GTP-binding protein [Thiomicrorhabdus aquaedulcis]|uniref:CobW family GTP-binding protein n=1 Tax=Thiomicrorhabdus aquaedulcis TaxID=2211106 RepID=UPI000FD70C2B|nr:GTP-binding protein [Thiomicrorhabdus aquaedulcis]
MTTPLPIHLITGLLGSGKTTTLKQLIAQKPQNEHWGIIINEFGEIDIDAASVSADTTNDNNQTTRPGQSSIQVLSVAGGCVCCNAQLGLTQALHQLLHPTNSTNPTQKTPPLHRIWIEPTGLGHPAKIIDTLTRTPFSRPLALQKILCVITPAQLTQARWQKSNVMRDLVTLADVILFTKTDLSTPEAVHDARTLLSNLYPPKTDVWVNEAISHSSNHSNFKLPLSAVLGMRRVAPFALLSGVVNPSNPASAIRQNSHPQHQQDVTYQACSITSTLPGVVTCIAQYGNRHDDQNTTQTTTLKSIGWVFTPKTQFSRVALQRLFSQISPTLSRAKGLLKTGLEWQLVNWADNQLTFNDIAWRTDSRLELIFSADVALEITALEAQLLGCICKQ